LAKKYFVKRTKDALSYLQQIMNLPNLCAVMEYINEPLSENNKNLLKAIENK